MTRRAASADRRDRGFRPDIEGLRAVAVLSVMVYHVAPGLLPGGFVGVDIFFVISGFLITSHLASEHLRTGSISLSRFYARRALRLIPAATVTLVGTAVAVALFVPRAFWAQFGWDVIASAFYVVNWTLAAQSIDYLAEDDAVSPAQHFWSLAVEEQYYLIWPVLMIAAAFVAGLLKQTKRRGFAVMGVLVILASAGWAMAEFAQQNPAAYFVTTTRLWELAVGSVVAIIYPRLLRATSGRSVATLVGLAAIVASMWAIQETLQWPNPWAFLPIAGAALLLGAGGGASPTWAERVLGIAPMVWVGGLSYSLYLWHWPVVVVAEQVLGKTGVLQGVSVLVTSFVLAWLTRVTLENPIRFHPRLRARARNGIAVGVVGALLSAAAGGALVWAGSAASGERAARAPGAAVLRTPVSDTPLEELKWIGQPMTPLPVNAYDDVPTHYEDDCIPPSYRPEVKICTYGDRDADRTIAMIGDSKIMQWQPAIERIAEQRGYKLILLTKNACAFADAPAVLDGKAEYPACDQWRGPAFEELKKHKPEVVFTGQGAIGAFPLNASSRERLIDGLASMYTKLRDAGFPTVIMGDNRSPGQAIPVCLQNNASDPTKCTFTMEEVGQVGGFPLQSAAVAKAGGTRVNADGEVTLGTDKGLVLVDMMDAICPPQLDACPPVIGNVLVYRQGSHITATYISTLTKRVAHALDEADVFDASGERAARAPGAAVLSTPVSDTPADELKWIGEPMTPPPGEAGDDVPEMYHDDCDPARDESKVKVCTYGDLGSDKTIALIGDSKVMQWEPALDRIAEQRHYKLLVLTKNACALADAPAAGQDDDGKAVPYPACDKWRGPALAELKKHKPAVVFTGQRYYYAYPDDATGPDRLTAGLVRTYTALREAGFTTVVIGDNPFRGGSIPPCLIDNEADPSVCTFPRDDNISGFPSQSAAVAELGGTRVNADGKVASGKDKDLVLVDMTDAICPPQLERCPPVIGNVLIYGKGSHITTTYIRTLTKRLAHALDEAGVFDWS